jgi:transposase
VLAGALHLIDRYGWRVYTRVPRKLRSPQESAGTLLPINDHRERRWRHLDKMQYRTILIARVPLVNCPTHGIHGIGLPRAEKNPRLATLFEALVIDWSLESSPSAVARLPGLSREQVSRNQARAVERGLARRERQKPARIGVDETFFQ